MKRRNFLTRLLQGSLALAVGRKLMAAENSPAGASAMSQDAKQAAAPASAGDDKQKLVYCGNDCTLCPKFNDKRCGGCMTDQVVDECLKCEPRKCCRERKLANCAYCPEYPCKKIDEMYAKWTANGYGEGAKICRGRLDKIKKSAAIAK